MKKFGLIVAIIAILGLVGTTLFLSSKKVSFSWISSKISGGPTIESTSNEVRAHGWDFRSYTYIDTAGRVCTAVFTDEKGGNIDCDFPPVGFDYAAFAKSAK